MINKENREIIRDIIKPESKLILYLYIYALVAGIINLALPLGIQAIISFLTYGQLSTSWWVLVLIVTFTVALSGFFKIKQMIVTEQLQQKLFVRIANDVIKKLPKVNTAKLKEKYLPEIVNRFFDVAIVQKSLAKILLDFSTDSLTILLGLIVLSFYHPFFAFFGIFLLIFLGLLAKYTGIKGLETAIVESDYKYEVLNWIEEVARNYIPFKFSTKGSLSHSNSENDTTGYIKYRRKHFRVLIVQFTSLVLFKVLIVAFLLGFGSYLVLEGTLNIGQFVASELIIILVVNSIEKLIQNIEAIYDAIVSFYKISKIYILDEEQEEGARLNIKDDLNFSFKNIDVKGDHNNITGDNLTAHSGDVISISGSGKSDRVLLLDLFAGLNSEYNGELKLNGLEYKSIRTKDLRKVISYIDFNSGIYKSEISELLECEESEYLKTNLDVSKRKINTHGTGLTENEKWNILLEKALNKKSKLLIIDGSGLDLNESDKKYFIDKFLEDKNKLIFIKTNDKEIIDKTDINIYVEEDGKLTINRRSA